MFPWQKDRMDNIMASDGISSTVCFSAGNSDGGKRRIDELLRNCVATVKRMRAMGGTPVVCGILLRRDVGTEWSSSR